MFQLIWEFGFWTFEVIYGVDLWTILTVQRFEPEVESWNDISWHKAKFVYDLESPTLVQPGMLEHALIKLNARNLSRIIPMLFIM